MRKHRRKMTSTLFFAILGGIAAIGAGISQFFENKKSEEAVIESENRAKAAEMQLNEKADALILAQKEIIKLQEEQKKLLSKLNTRAEKNSLENALTGSLNLRFKGLNNDDLIIRRFGGKKGLNATNTFSQMIQWKPKFISVGQEDFINVKIVENKMLVTLRWYDLNGEWIVEIEDNFWRRNPTNTGKFNYDDNGFEVIDNQGNIALNLDFKQKNEIVVQGYIYRPQNGLVAIGGENGVIFPPKSDEYAAIIQNINRVETRQLFEYSGNGWLGKRKVKK